jgi:prophage DNA circulation protein
VSDFTSLLPGAVGNANALATSSGTSVPAGVFSQDVEHQWKSVAFPAASFRVRLRQDLAEHKYSEKDGAEMEPVGRAPLEFSARIPFLNGTFPAKQETWPFGQLYPGQLTAFINACADKSKGTLQHPFFGYITCVLHEMDAEWSGATQDGVWVSATWIETFDATNDTAALRLRVSPVSQAIGAAQDLDAALTLVQPPLPTLPVFAPTFTDAMRSIQGAFDTATILSQSVAGTINNVGYRVNAVLDAINRVGDQFDPNGTTNNSAIRNVMNGPTRDACDRLRVACIQLRNKIANTGQDVALYVTGAPMSLPLVGGILNVPMADLIRLNGPSVVQDVELPTGTSIRYYLQAA